MNQRYRIDIGTIIDQKHSDILTLTQIRNRLNTYENTLTEKDQLLKKQLTVTENLNKQLAEKEKQIINIKRTLDECIENERTHLGANSLQQFKEAIQ